MKNEEGYTGEHEKWFQLNKRIVIRRQAGETEGQAYLIRRTLISFGKWFSIKYHQILMSDNQCEHNHPWNFITIIMKGGYYEWTPVTQTEKGKMLHNRIGVDGDIEVQRWHGAGSIMYRPAKWRHRLELKTTEPLFHVNRDNGNLFITELPTHTTIAHTLVFTFKVVQDWGFFTKNGWIFWKKYNENRDC